MSQPGQTIRDVAIPFKYVRSRVALCILVVLFLGMFAFVFHPQSYDQPGSHPGPGGILDQAIRSLPPTGRVIATLCLQGYFLHLILAYYLPCVRADGMVVFDGGSVYGFDFWGAVRKMPVTSVTSFGRARGALRVRDATGARIAIPIPLLEIERSQEQDLMLLLKAGVSQG